jgi:pyruvate,water dikinase
VAGGKGANLGELTGAGLPVPPGFVVTAQAYLETMDQHGQRKYLAESIERVPMDDPVALGVLADSLTKVVRASTLLPETVDGILRASHEITDEPAIAVVVQRMVDSDRSGVIFSADPRPGRPRHVLVEGAFGLGEVVVGGPRLLEIHIGDKSHKIVRGPDGGDLHVELSADEAIRRVLGDLQAIELAQLGLRVEQHYGTAQDLEWAIHPTRQPSFRTARSWSRR